MVPTSLSYTRNGFFVLIPVCTLPGRIIVLRNRLEIVVSSLFISILVWLKIAVMTSILSYLDYDYVLLFIFLLISIIIINFFNNCGIFNIIGCFFGKCPSLKSTKNMSICQNLKLLFCIIFNVKI